VLVAPDVIGMVALSLILALAAAAATAGLIALLFPVFRRYALARPNARSLHTVPTPQGGGGAVAIVMLIAAAVALYWVAGSALLVRADVVSLFAGICLIAVVGMVDDVRPIAVAPRLVLQLLITGMVVLALPSELRIVPPVPLWLERAVLVVAMVWFVNLVNFMDGMDFMSVTEATAIAAGIILMWASGILPETAGLVALALLGAIGGFAWFNRPVARLFLGDVGSLPIGLLLGWLLIVLAGRGHIVAALVLPLYYVVDATVTLLRRIIGGERWWESHRTHFYQRAYANGLSTWQVITRVALLNLVLVALALFAALEGGAMVGVAVLVIAAVCVAAVLADFARPRPIRKRVEAN
jgi:UDP-N-acetylmuramyl pentapeptide phosphotransferase/UDP-N-acetylglucosamine-1-phosphate transferase